MTLAEVGGGREANLCWEACSVPLFLSFPPSWIAPELQSLPKACPLSSPPPVVLACWHHAVTLQHLGTEAAPASTLFVRNHPEGKGKNRVQTKVPKS